MPTRRRLNFGNILSGQGTIREKRKNVSGPKIETEPEALLCYTMMLSSVVWHGGVGIKGISVGHINEVTLHLTQIVVSIGMGDRLCY